MEKMDIAEVEENFFAASDAKLHGGMCKLLSAIHCKVLEIFPVLESARPRSKSGIQSLCALHVALERTRNILQHCSESSKLYLAITGDSIILKFEKARSALQNSLSRVEDIVPQSIGCQITEIVRELEGLVFSLDPSEKQVGDEIIALLQKGRKFDSSSNDMNELEIFHRAASRLGITSSRAALTERRALKKLIDRARMEDDKRKESIVAYLLHLMRKYSKLFRSELSDDNDSQGSTPCSPTVQGSFEEPEGNCQTYDRQFSKHSSFNFKPNGRKSGQLPLLPEELRCPISLQLMHDPVIISSGQTYERVCIEKWFSDGHTTCPKTQQHLSHLNLTPNYCVKGLIANWCEQNGVPLPSAPPESLDLNYWRLALSDRENLGSCKLKEVKVVPLEENCSDEEVESDEVESVTVPDLEEAEVNVIERYEHLLSLLCGEGGVRKKCRVVERIRRLLKDDEEARIYMGANGFVEALKEFLESAVEQRIDMAQEVGAMALFNLAVNNNRNKETMLSAGMLPLLEEMIADSNSHGSATALYLTLSCHEGAKGIIGSSNKALPFLIGSLEPEVEPSRKQDALHTLYNLSSHPPCIPNLISHGITANLQLLLSTSGDHRCTEKSVAVLTNLASSKPGKDEILSTPGLVASLATILDEGEPVEQEQVVMCLVGLCAGDEKCSQMVLQEGVIPALVSISVNGTARGKEKAQKLLMLFREQRQREPSPVRRPRPLVENDDQSPSLEGKPLYKSSSKRKMGKAFSFLWKSRNQSMYQC